MLLGNYQLRVTTDVTQRQFRLAPPQPCAGGSREIFKMPFAQFANAPQPPPEAVPDPHAEPTGRGTLQHAASRINDERHTQELIEAELKGFYSATPAQRIQAYTQECQELAQAADPDRPPPTMFIVNSGGVLHLAYAMLRPPQDVIPQIRGNTVYRRSPTILCFGHRQNGTQLPTTVPVDPDKIFSPVQFPAGDFEAASQADPATVGADPFDRTEGDALATVPAVPLFGQAITRAVVTGLYGPTGNGTWGWRHLPIHLRDCVNQIADEPTKQQLQRSIMSLLTRNRNNRNSKQAGCLSARPAVVPEFLQPWLLRDLNTALSGPDPTQAPPVPPAAPPVPPEAAAPPAAATGAETPPGTQHPPPGDSPPGQPPSDHSPSDQSPPNQSQANQSSQQSHQHQAQGDQGTDDDSAFETWDGPNAGAANSVAALEARLAQARARNIERVFFVPSLAREAGINALSIEHKNRLLFYTNQRYLRDVPDLLRDLLSCPRRELVAFWTSRVMPHLEAQCPDFIGFSHPIQLITRTRDMDFIHPEAPFGDTIIGGQMRRPKLDTRDQRELYEVQHDPTVHLSVQPNQINRLKGKTPLTLEGWNELKAILNRTIAFCQLFVPGLPLADAARTVLTYLTRHVNLHDIDRVPGWSDAKTKEIIYAFTWFEKDHVGGIPATDTMADTSFQIHRKVPNMQTLMSVVTSQQPYFHPAQLPSGLRPNPLPPPPSNPNRPARGPPAPAAAPPPPAPPLAPPGTEHRNRDHNVAFKRFWEAVPEAQRRNAGISRLLVNAGTTTDIALASLNLRATDCAQFHLKGICTRRACIRDHTPRSLNNEKAATVAAQLQQGLQAL